MRQIRIGQFVLIGLQFKAQYPFKTVVSREALERFFNPYFETTIPLNLKRAILLNLSSLLKKD